ncbi:MAG: MFS transporter [Solirubrobacteraceae bacterium]|nr:MFS transporter [Solirubrobacteraceae bacterium]
MRRFLPALAAGLVLADSSVVTLALPEILRSLDATVAGVAWVLTAFNIALAVAAIPAARLAPKPAYAGGLVIFAAACLVCAKATSLEMLIAGRVVQGVAGAAVVAAALALVRAGDDPDPRVPSAGLRTWALAGVLGAVLGPAAGGLLTEYLSWEAMFALQAPVALLAIGGLLGVGVLQRDDGSGRPAFGPLLALAFLSAALTAALFLLVVMLIEGWRYGPAGAAVAVSVMPVAAILARPLEARIPVAAAAGAGTVAVAGGLVALGLLPDASWWWLVAPQALIGFGLGAALPALTTVAVPHVTTLAGPASWTIMARHAGVVVGLLLLTPVFTADLDTQQDRTERAGLAVLLDAPIGLEAKIDLAQKLADTVTAADGRLPDLAPAFTGVDGDPQVINAIADTLDDQLDRAGTAAFSRSLQLAGLLALLALIPLLFTTGLARGAALAGAGVAALIGGGLAIGYVASGGGTYEPTATRNPCGARERPKSDAQYDDVQRVLLSVLDGGACKLKISREELLLNLVDPDTRRTLSEDELADGLRAGVTRARDDGTLGFVAATALQLALSTGATDEVIGQLLDR